MVWSRLDGPGMQACTDRRRCCSVFSPPRKPPHLVGARYQMAFGSRRIIEFQVSVEMNSCRAAAHRGRLRVVISSCTVPCRPLNGIEGHRSPPPEDVDAGPGPPSKLPQQAPPASSCRAGAFRPGQRAPASRRSRPRTEKGACMSELPVSAKGSKALQWDGVRSTQSTDEGVQYHYGVLVAA
jgi:hypothetical protein